MPTLNSFLPKQCIWLFMALLLGSCAQATGKDESINPSAPIRIGGSAETLEVIETLTTAYETSGAEVKFDFFPPSQSSSGIQGVQDGMLDIGAVSHVPEALNQLQYIPLPQTPLVMAVHQTVTGIQNLTTQQLRAIYQGSLTNWQELGGPDAEIVLLDFTEDENEKKLLRQHYLGADLPISDKAIVFPEDDELFETALITPYSIAALPFDDELEDAAMQILSLDGVAPTPDNVELGNYPMVMSLGIVVAETPNAETQALIDFLKSPAGQAALQSEASETETEDVE